MFSTALATNLGERWPTGKHSSACTFNNSARLFGLQGNIGGHELSQKLWGFPAHQRRQNLGFWQSNETFFGEQWSSFKDRRFTGPLRQVERWPKSTCWGANPLTQPLNLPLFVQRKVVCVWFAKRTTRKCSGWSRCLWEQTEKLTEFRNGGNTCKKTQDYFLGCRSFSKFVQCTSFAHHLDQTVSLAEVWMSRFNGM